MASNEVSQKPYLKLHFLVIIVAFTAILGELISLPATTLVVWRTGIAALVLGLWLRGSSLQEMCARHRNTALLTGLILGLHWLTFFGAVKLSNVSICLIGMATTSLFTAASEAIHERRKPNGHELLLGALIIPGIILIAGVEKGYIWGLLCGVISAALAAIFPVINKALVRDGAKASSVTFYELLTACLVCFLASLCFQTPMESYIPVGLDWLWLGILAIICTVYAFSLHIRLLEYFSAYETTLVINFEPVYGIILAAIFFAEHKTLHPLFFVGAGVIILVNMAYPVLERRFQKRKNT